MNKPDTKGKILYDSTCIRYLQWSKFRETGSRIEVTRGWGGRMESGSLMGTHFEFGMINVMEMDDGGGCTI